MAKGITESDVHAAADALVAAGERPTIERIRAHLGTGSPNTVTRWLETWWQALGARLQGHQARLAVPEAPETVASLAADWWALALKHATGIAREVHTADRAALQADQAALQLDRENFATEAAALRDQADASAHAERLASSQAVELQRLTSQLEGQVEEVAAQRDSALARTTEVDVARNAAEARLQQLQDAGRAERESLAQHVRTVEDRAHAEIDRARQETKELKNRLVAATREQAAIEKSLHQAAEKAKVAATKASRDAGIERARADALEKQLAKLQDLPAALEAAMRRSETPIKKARSPGSKRAVRVFGKRAKVSEES
ncbi:DNA-binding protein [Lysobacter sp. A289]